jgi:hypothetical protein
MRAPMKLFSDRQPEPWAIIRRRPSNGWRVVVQLDVEAALRRQMAR